MANLLSWLGNQLHGVEAQLNPWDNGQTYNTVVNHAPVQQQPAPQPQAPHPQQNTQLMQARQSAALARAPQMLNTQGKLNWLQHNAPQALQITQAPTPDYVKAAGQVVNGVGNFMLNGTAKLANQGAGVIENLGGNIAGDTQKLFGDQAGGQRTINAVKQRVDQRLLQKGSGLFGAGGIYNSSDALHNANPGDVALRAGGTALQSVAERFAPKGATNLVKGGVPLASKLVNGGKVGALTSSLYSTGSQLSNTGKVDPLQLAKDTAIGTATGVAIPAAGVAIQKAAPVVAKGAIKATDAVANKINEPVAIAAEKASGLPRVNVLNDNEAHTLSDYADLANKRWNAPNDVRNQVVMQARNAAKTAGFDITNMTPAEADRQISSYLQARDNFNSAYGVAQKQMMQGGYIKLPSNSSDDLVKKVFTKQTDANALYHGTEVNNAINILKEGYIKPNTSDVQNAVSFARNRNAGIKLSPMWGKPVRLVADNAAVQNAVGKTAPYVDGQLNRSVSHMYEAEQRIVNKDVPISTLKRVEVDSSLLSPYEMKNITQAAKKAGIPIVDTQNASDMRKVLDGKPNHIGLNGNTLNNSVSPQNLGQILKSADQPHPTSAGQIGKSSQLPHQLKGVTNPAGDVPLSARSAPVQDGMTNKSLQTPEGQVGDKPVTNPLQTAPLSSSNNTIKMPNTQGDMVGNSFTQGVKTSNEVSKEVRGQVAGQHEVRSTNDLISNVKSQIQSEGLKPALNRTLNELNVPLGQTSDETLARALEIAKAHDAIGTPEAQSIAADLYNKVSEHGVGKGQGAQILSMLARSSPAGLRNKAFKDLKAAGVTLTDSIKNEIQGHINTITKLPEGQARDYAIAVFQKAVGKYIPQNKLDTAVSLWKAGLLSGVKTQGGNFVSNATFGGLKKIADVPTAMTDKLISLGTGKRSATMTARGIASGTKEGAQNAMTTLKTGIDLRNVGQNTSGKYEQHAEINMGNKVMQKVLGNPANFVFRGMSAADQPFYYSALKNSLYDQAKADGLNAGLRGRALNDHMNNMVQNPTEKMVINATKDANKSVLGFDTAASKAVNGLHQGIEHSQLTSQEKAIVNGVINMIAPFTKVPSAFISRTIDFTPLGIGKEVLAQVFKRQFDQRGLSKAIGEGITGTGVIGLGYALASTGQLSGDYPKNDPKKAALWKAQGITPNSVKLGGKWVSLNYLGPLGLLFNAGQNMQQASQTGQSVPTQVLQAVAGMGQGLLGQSFLQGFSGFSDAIKDPARNASSFVNSQAGSIVPSIVNDIANATDSMQRQVNNPAQAIQGRIPGLREGLTPKIDSFGNDLSQAAGSGIETAINPLKPSQETSTPLLSELSRLGQSGQAVMPLTVKSIGSGTSLIKLTPEQSNQRQKQVGGLLTPVWTAITADPAYAKLDDTQKSNVLQNALSDINSAVNYMTAQSVDPSKLGKMPSGMAGSIVAGATPDAAHYLNNVKVAGGGGSSSSAQIASNIDSQSKAVLVKYNAMNTAQRTKAFQTQNDAQYQYNLAKYNNDKANGSITPVQDIARKTSLAKDQIGANYSQDVRTLYGMSKAQIANYVSKASNGQDLVNQLSSYDQALKGAGLTSSLKFKTGVTSTARRSSSGRKVARSKAPVGLKTATSFSHSMKIPKVAKAPSFKQSGAIASATFKKSQMKSYHVAKTNVPKIPKVQLKKIA